MTHPAVPVPGDSDPRTEGADRRQAFFERSGAALTCVECRTTFDHIDAEWLDAHVRESIGCPGCGLSSRIPVDDDGSGS